MSATVGGRLWPPPGRSGSWRPASARATRHAVVSDAPAGRTCSARPSCPGRWMLAEPSARSWTTVRHVLGSAATSSATTSAAADGSRASRRRARRCCGRRATPDPRPPGAGARRWTARPTGRARRAPRRPRCPRPRGARRRPGARCGAATPTTTLRPRRQPAPPAGPVGPASPATSRSAGPWAATSWSTRLRRSARAGAAGPTMPTISPGPRSTVTGMSGTMLAASTRAQASPTGSCGVVAPASTGGTSCSPRPTTAR